MADEENIKPDDNLNQEKENSDKNMESTGAAGSEIITQEEDTTTSKTEEPEVDVEVLQKQIMDEAQRAQDAVRLAEEGMAEQIKNMENSESERSDP